MTNQTKGTSTAMEFLQVIHLTKHGKVYNLDLREMENRVMDNGSVKEHGTGIQPRVEENEFLLAMIRMRTVKRTMAVSTKLLLFDGLSMVPTTVFLGAWGDAGPSKGQRFWYFPQLDAVATLHRIMTEGG